VNNIFVYCETEEKAIADVSLELLTKARSLANLLECKVEAVVIGDKLNGIEKQLSPYGVDIIHIAEV
jgi:electron transfer flavoprotein alpha subunit